MNSRRVSVSPSTVFISSFLHWPVWREESLSCGQIDCLKLCPHPENGLHSVSPYPAGQLVQRQIVILIRNTNSSWLSKSPWVCRCHGSIFLQKIRGRRFISRTRISRAPPANYPHNSQVPPHFPHRATNRYIPWIPTPLPSTRESRKVYSSFNQGFTTWASTLPRGLGDLLLPQAMFNISTQRSTDCAVAKVCSWKVDLCQALVWVSHSSLLSMNCNWPGQT